VDGDDDSDGGHSGDNGSDKNDGAIVVIIEKLILAKRGRVGKLSMLASLGG
jgi:hypothetical protein